MLVSALAPSEKFYALALFEITLRMCFRYNTALSARIMGDFVNLAILMTNHVHLKVTWPSEQTHLKTNELALIYEDEGSLDRI